MPYFYGPVFQTTDPAVGDLLERAITALIKQWRSDGQHNPPELPFATYVQSHLHALATSATPTATPASPATLGILTKAVSQKDRRDYLSVKQAAARLGISAQRVRQLCDEERLTAIRGAKSWQISAASVEARRAEQETA